MRDSGISDPDMADLSAGAAAHGGGERKKRERPEREREGGCNSNESGTLE